MKLVLKIGGAALENSELVAKFCSTVSQLSKDGHQVLVVHGGGAALSRTLKQLGIESKFVDGLRVTDAKTRDAALMVLGGLLNKQLAAAIGARGQSAVGICGSDLQLCIARKKRLSQDLGFVGEIVHVNAGTIEALWQQRTIAVVASLAACEHGEFYNVNADEMASAIAAAVPADALIFLTDVAGVKNAQGEVFSRLGVKEIDELKADGTISGGMLPKLDACKRALLGGVGSVRIVQAAQVSELTKLFEAPLECGTELVAHA
ncbi:MAG TPA: acetylglutamate kinase [Candidatus Koribacter sp.]|jgi:acetylglutamate kinase